MKKLSIIVPILLLTVLLFSGCRILSVEEMYCLPKRSEAYYDLQSAIDKAMTGLSYCAPLSGEYQQTVQSADLDGDGVQEYLLFAKGGSEHPLKILIFEKQADSYVHTRTIQSSGTAFDRVGYVEMDEQPGVELVVGHQLSDQLLRSVSVYTFSGGEPEQTVCVNYTRFLTADLDSDGLQELMVLNPGSADGENGVAEYYRIREGESQRSVQVSMSEPVTNLKRILVGNLYGGNPAVYVASTADERSIITDVFAVVDGTFRNVTFSNESGTNVKTQRNYYIYSEDIDDDGVTELPAIMESGGAGDGKYDLLRWYAMTSRGDEIEKLYTFHNFDSGWYLELDEDLAHKLKVTGRDGVYEFYLTGGEKILTILQAAGDYQPKEGETVLYAGESVSYVAVTEKIAEDCGITEKSLMNSFRLISPAWKTGE